LELPVGRPVHGVEEHGLLVQQQVGVVADPLGDGVDVLKQVEPVVVGPHPVQIVGYLAHAIHNLPPYLSCFGGSATAHCLPLRKKSASPFGRTPVFSSARCAVCLLRTPSALLLVMLRRLRDGTLLPLREKTASPF